MENSVSVLKSIAFPTFKDITEFPGYSLGLAHHLKGDVLMSKPIFIGSTVLDLSKKVMYEFFTTMLNQNGVIKQNYLSQIQIVFV